MVHVDHHVELQVVVMGKVLSVGAEVLVHVHVDEGGVGVGPLLEARGHGGGEVLIGKHFPDSGDFEQTVDDGRLVRAAVGVHELAVAALSQSGGRGLGGVEPVIWEVEGLLYRRSAVSCRENNRVTER